ncbi:MAG TPA: hypothetical protein VEX60_17945 [Pyrinomonadaceae bacterium]|nr:hypothetical protein [Pyrinomonadaceae bacterium]
MFSNRLTRATVAVVAIYSLCAVTRAQQVADPDFKPAIARPAYKQGRGPRVLLDEAHNNFHTATGRYQPFAELIRRDGYVVEGSAKPFNRESLKGARVLVIANALNERNVSDWSLPNPSAFTDEEIEAVRVWVRGGGSLLLIADHMPMGGAAEKLGSAFGVRWNNGFALPEKQGAGALLFSRDDGTLKDHTVTRGRSEDERVERVATFTGSAFQVEGVGVEPLLIFGKGIVSLTPQVAWQFTPETPRVSVEGWYQGATLRYGKGRVALFGEAAMFTAQLGGPNRVRVGMNAPEAKQNPQLLLNVLHWLSGKL